MTVFYRGPDVLITHEAFRVLGPRPRAFALRDLDSVYVVEEHDSSVTWVSTGSAGVAAVVMATAGLDVPPALALLGGAALLGAAAAAAGCVRARSRRFELRATHRGEPVLLFASADERRFGQVRRALVRGMEQRAGS